MALGVVRGMHYVTVVTKGGPIYYGPIWTWRPGDGWFSLAGDDNFPIRIYLKDVSSAISWDRTHLASSDCTRCKEECTGIERVDHLERARKEGWVST